MGHFKSAFLLLVHYKCQTKIVRLNVYFDEQLLCIMWVCVFWTSHCKTIRMCELLFSDI